ncbi:polypeptide N-acetylgalactosaminyltransferase 5 [Lepeophtheirus salmonis]|uniref:Polypeptide N-acetylgalactosaminyltransferase n=1 Tax=Lepeophtheirus salmonis TaxID=72036 RepID=A0A0K2U1N1_LEPSM|nr:polypeptide N-acetylgalactosaminyltransferase 5-like [Lepeophtheirus salmonis]
MAESSTKTPSSSQPRSSWIFHILWAIGCVFLGVAVNRFDYNYIQNEKSSNTLPPKEEESLVYTQKTFLVDELHPNPRIRGIDESTNLTNWPPGHMGLGVEVSRMDFKTKAKKNKMYQQHAFEEFISELIPLDRELPDFRDPYCDAAYGNRISELSATSIIICFHNEARSTLLRSIHSVLNRSPLRLIAEVILVDDASTLPHLGEPLDEYIAQHFEGLVKVVRLKERHGLMRSRMEGIKASSAQILTFLDSHIEVTVGWLEPLLKLIADDPMAVPCPVIDAINDTTLYYTFIHKDLFGLFNWKMEFEWHELVEEERKAKVNAWAPHANPVMAGGLFSIDKSWFEHLGFYDEGMNIWGAENLELSFKIWMCGGNIQVVPCSRVGHIYRSWSPYKVNVGDIKRNSIRVAKVWMDEFQYLYYDRLGNFQKSGDEKLGDYGDVQERVLFRKNLECHDFRWYLDNIAHHLPYHELIGAGEIRQDIMCVDKNDKIEKMNEPVNLTPCHNLGGNQYWWMSSHRYLMRDYLCIGVLEDKVTVAVAHCGKIGPWTHDPKLKQFKYDLTQTCLAGEYYEDGHAVMTMAPCNPEDDRQQWVFTRYDPVLLPYERLF